MNIRERESKIEGHHIVHATQPAAGSPSPESTHILTHKATIKDLRSELGDLRLQLGEMRRLLEEANRRQQEQILGVVSLLADKLNRSD